MFPLVLASQSPRRRELLAQLEDSFEQLVCDIDESQQADEQATDYVKRLAMEKAEVGLSRCQQPSLVIGADTIVVSNQQLLGKPRDRQHFEQMMLTLSGGSHQVLTAVAIASPEHVMSNVVATDVTFCALSEQQIAWYWQTGEPQDKAGGYGIQGLGGRFVEKINGSYSAVVGLPLCETAALLAAMRARISGEC